MNDALRTALVAAGRILAAKSIHGRFRIARRPLGSTVVTFTAREPDTLAIDVEALAEAAIALQAAGLPATRIGCDHVFISAH